jgi:hypothetical protein
VQFQGQCMLTFLSGYTDTYIVKQSAVFTHLVDSFLTSVQVLPLSSFVRIQLSFHTYSMNLQGWMELPPEKINECLVP